MPKVESRRAITTHRKMLSGSEWGSRRDRLDNYAIIWQAKTMVNMFTVNKRWHVRLAALAIASLMAARSY